MLVIADILTFSFSFTCLTAYQSWLRRHLLHLLRLRSETQISPCSWWVYANWWTQRYRNGRAPTQRREHRLQHVITDYLDFIAFYNKQRATTNIES